MSDQGDIVEISYVPDEPGEGVPEEHEEHPEKPKKSAGRKKNETAKKIQKKLKEQEEVIAKVVEERDDFKDKYLRSLAEVDNFRKRVKKEKEEYQKYVLGDFILGLLEVFDNMERALKASSSTKPGAVTSEDVTSIVSGVQMIFKQLGDLLKKNNVSEVDALGKEFDPNLHQALSKVEQEGIDHQEVVEVYQKGFNYNGKLLRPALVKVAIPIVPPPPAPENAETDDSTEE